MTKRKIVINNSVGLHARPAALFAELAQKYTANISVTCNQKTVNAKSLLGLLGLGASKGSSIEIVAEGLDELEAINALISLIENNFGE